MKLEDKIGIGLIPTLVGAAIFGATCFGGCWGTRSVKDVFTFQYRDRPAVVKHKDVRMGSDEYWILLDNRDKILYGTIVSDDGKEITINNVSHSVRDYQPEKE